MVGVQRAFARGVVLLFLAVIVLAGCQALPVKPAPETTPDAPPPTATATPEPTARVTAENAPVRAGTPIPTIVRPTPQPVGVPIVGDALAAGWDAQYSWSTGFEAAEEKGPGGAPAFRATFYGESSGLFLAVKQDSPAAYPLASTVGARVRINPGAEALPLDRLKLAVLSSDQRAFWDMGEQPVPFDAQLAASEATLPATGLAALPANTWTEINIKFADLPSPPRGRYLTGLYLKADNLVNRSILLSGLELMMVPDETHPEPVTIAEVDDTSLRVTFSEDVDPATASDPANYRIASAQDSAYATPQAPTAAAYEPETMSVVLTLPQPPQPGAEYSVEVKGIADLAPQRNVMAAPVALSFTAGVLTVKVEPDKPLHAISPTIYGIAGTTGEYMRALRPGLSNWGGNPTSRYNWELGNAFNAGSDWEYRNTDYGFKSKSVTDDFIADALKVGADVRVTLPTLGWVAKNTDSETCSFVGKDGKCYNPGATCQKPGPTANPNRSSVKTDVDWVVRWVKHLIEEKGFNVRFFAMDNEPDLWGFTHYDVHPKCATYEEILSKYLEYATAVRAAAPDAELLGPVSCCWYFYWNSPAGDADKAEHGNKDFLPWFLEEVKKHDEKAGVRTLDALDIHYYPENVYNDKDDPETAAARIEATRGLWDESYVDPSWIGQPVKLIPRMKQLIAENYPGTKLFISEWNFGGDKSMSGAIAIADALGIFGEQDLYAASYYQRPELNSPGFFGFKLYTNYDDKGGRFGDTALPTSSSNREQVAAYAGRDSKTGKVTVMLINKQPDRAAPVRLEGLTAGRAELYRYSQAEPEGIVRENVELTANGSITLPSYSITLIVMSNQGK